MPGKTGPRRRYEDNFKRRMVLEAAAPDTSVAEVARRHGLNANLVFNWRKKFGANSMQSQLEESEPECQLVPVDIEPDNPPKNVEVALPERASPGRGAHGHAAPADHAAGGMLEIALPCGSRVRCSSGVEPTLLGEALTALRPVRTADTQ